MPRGPVRRSQLISPFGVGSTVVLPDGTSVIACGLDHWYRREDVDLDDPSVDVDEFKVREWRLERMLGVSHFRLPPDHRRSRSGATPPNAYLTVPFLRFPRWHQCSRCGRIFPSSLFRSQSLTCEHCQKEGHKTSLAQVRFIAVCDRGHLQDFPWLEWVHRTAHPTCKGPLRLISSGSISIAGHIVRCEGCDVPDRSMSGSVLADPGRDTTQLTERLTKEGRFTCRGLSPWLGDEEGGRCGRPLHVALRAASNVYFPHVASAIYLPRAGAPAELIELLSSSNVGYYIDVLHELGHTPTVDVLRKKFPEQLSRFTDSEVEEALRLASDETGEAEEDPAGELELQVSEEDFRREELGEINRDRRDPDLMVQSEAPTDYGKPVSEIGAVRLVTRLRETRAFAGFTRVYPETDAPPSELRRQLRRSWPPYASRWLPAYVVHGEGILLTFNEERLHEWEMREGVRSRVKPLRERFQQVTEQRHLRERAVSPRLVLLHTFAHVVINQLTFECGYSSAALRERLYVADSGERMGSILIYTAAGDSDGTLGGLVRMGRPGHLEPVINTALEKARWCSADPVCMEVGASGGQGPDSCNLAACHNCALVPETACELFNRFLDRGLLVGTPDDAHVGFFAEQGQ